MLLQGFRFTDCSASNKAIGVFRHVPNEFSCEAVCNIDNELCQHYKYEKETETCTLYDDNFEINCNQIMGPIGVYDVHHWPGNTQHCLDMMSNS